MPSTEDLPESRFISGVYNYCDRWCEKCRFANRCMVYYREQERNMRHQLAGENPDNWDVVMEDVDESFKETLGMLQAIAEGMGVDLENAPAPPPEPDHTEDPLYREADSWSGNLRKLLARVQDEMPAIGESLAAQYAGETEESDTGAEVLSTLREVRDSYELLCRYCLFIPVKIARAVSSLDRWGSQPDIEEYEFDDGRGTAKLVYISLGKMVAALWRLAEFHREWFDDAVTLANGAESLRRQIDETFPSHQSFHRPGFDDEPEPGE